MMITHIFSLLVVIFNLLGWDSNFLDLNSFFSSIFCELISSILRCSFFINWPWPDLNLRNYVAFFFITCKSITRKTVFEVPTTGAYYSVFKPEFLVKYSLISVLSILVVYVLKIYYKSYRMGDGSELLSLLIPSLLNPKFCFRLFLVQSEYDINTFFSFTH